MKYLVKYYRWRYVRAREKMKLYRRTEPGYLSPHLTDAGRYYHQEKIKVKYGLKWWKHHPKTKFEGAELGLDTTFLDVDKEELSKIMDINPAVAEKNKKALSADYDWRRNAEGELEVVFVGDRHTDVEVKYVTITDEDKSTRRIEIMSYNGVPKRPTWLTDDQVLEIGNQGIIFD